MSISEKDTSSVPENRLPLIITIYGRVMAGVMMILGLREWAIILGMADSPVGSFEAMSTPWKFATMHLAVVDLVASVGLWQRVAWGNVVWIYAALAQIAMHTVFIGTFGSDFAIVALHVVTVAVFFVLIVMDKRASTAGKPS